MADESGNSPSAPRKSPSPPADAQSIGYGATGSDVRDTSTLGDLGSIHEGWDDGTELVSLESRYEIQSVLGRGGMGEVVLATDRVLRRAVAIKRLRSELVGHKKAALRFRAEAQAVASLNHYNIVQIYDFGRSKDGYFIVMEFVEGESLAEKIRRDGPLPLPALLELARHLCDALGLAHSRGVVHRDIKPGNILLSKNGVPKLTDFGLARQALGDTAQTQAGAILGTIDFMAPEQQRDAHTADARSDLWSLAATLYQAATGSTPRLIRAERIPESIRAVILKMLEDEPADRYQTADEFRDALTACAEGGRSAGTAAPRQKGQCPTCRATNNPDSRFCEKCGQSLQESCISCGANLPLDTSFCRECGTDLNAAISEREQRLAASQKQIERWARDSRLDEALLQLEEMSAIQHPRLQRFVLWAQETKGTLGREREQRRREEQEMVAAAQDVLRTSSAYNDAIQLLERIPAPLRSPATVLLLNKCQADHEEVKLLAAEIRTATSAKLYDGLLPKVERFLELKPQHENSRRLAEQLRKREEQHGRPVSYPSPPALPTQPAGQQATPWTKVSEFLANVSQGTKTPTFYTPPTAPTPPAPVTYATFGERFGASFVDGGVALVWLMVAAAMDSPGLAFVYVLVPISMEAGKWQASFGKRALGLQVTDMNGQKISWGKSFQRHLLKIVSAVPFYLGFVAALFTAKRQCWHDIWTDCVVIKRH